MRERYDGRLSHGIPCWESHVQSRVKVTVQTVTFQTVPAIRIYISDHLTLWLLDGKVIPRRLRFVTSVAFGTQLYAAYSPRYLQSVRNTPTQSQVVGLSIRSNWLNGIWLKSLGKSNASIHYRKEIRKKKDRKINKQIALVKWTHLSITERKKENKEASCMHITYF